jgi:YYY domain-containing protein
MNESVEAMAGPTPSDEPRREQGIKAYLPWAVLTLVIAFGAYVRFTGLNWDAGTHLHPDERFLTIVESGLGLPNSLATYFNTAISPLNPANSGNTFFVYGTLPIFFVRLLGEWLRQTTYDQIYIVGRATSAASDLVSLVFLYLLGRRLYNQWTGVLAAALASASVLLIQHAHFFVVDSMANTFVVIGLYLAVRVLDDSNLVDYLLFGLGLGMAMASKINTFPLAGVVVLAALIRYLKAAPEAKASEVLAGIKGLALAAFVSFVTFRVFQPYAFVGTSFFDIRINPGWMSSMTEILHQSSGEVDFPPALQWADRAPILFSLRNMVFWGMGIPLGVAAWLGWGWAAFETYKRRHWDRHLIPVAWTGIYFAWQSLSFTRAMRYQLPVYPTLALLAAWGIIEAWRRSRDWDGGRLRRIAPSVAAGAGGVVVLGTMFYALAFVRIYQEPMTRVAASRWIYHNVPAAVNFVVRSPDGNTQLEPIPTSLDVGLRAGEALSTSFVAQSGASLTTMILPHVTDLDPSVGPKSVRVTIYDTPALGTPVAEGVSGDLTGLALGQVEIPMPTPVPLLDAHTYGMTVSVQGKGGLGFRGQISLLQAAGGEPQASNVQLPSQADVLVAGDPQTLIVQVHQDGTMTGVNLPHVRKIAGGEALDGLLVSLVKESDRSTAIAKGELNTLSLDDNEQDVEVMFDRPVTIEQDITYQLTLTLKGQGALALRPSVLVSETSWDDGLPVNLEGYSYGGRYTGANQELYWPDNQDDNADGVPDKLDRLVESLSSGDYLIISSNRQYGTIARVPSRYPLTTEYYRLLFNCPAPKPVTACAASAQPGSTQNELGYKLVQVFQSDPNLLGLDFNDQSAEEAFTVYDHPKVLIFEHTGAFPADWLRAKLNGIDVSQVQNLTPKQLKAGASLTLMLPAKRWASQQLAGTWRAIFPPGNPLNQSNLLAAIIWWLLVALLGWLAFPIVRLAFPGLQDAGYPLARLVGLLLMAWGSWILGSAGVPVNRATIALVIGLMAIVAAGLAWRDREELGTYVRSHWRQMVWVEMFALIFFVIDLGIRIGNPDLWHPSKGGEKPMDLSYLTAVIKSTGFPPYDPWFAGGYINYYYFGFVLVGMPIKLLGLVPEVAYNLVLPTLFSLLALGAYCVGTNLLASRQKEPGGLDPRIAGVAAALMMVLLGNLGTVRLIYDSLRQLGGGLGVGLIDALRGLGQVIFLHTKLPIALDHWYWNPSRSIPPGPGEPGPITEFPFFTFLYGDLHAHMISLPLTLAALAWAVSWVLASREGRPKRWLDVGIGLFIGALLVGSLKPTNTWDFPVYLTLGLLATIAGAWVRERSLGSAMWVRAAWTTAALAGLALLLYLPFSQWYGQGYTQPQLWQGSKTPISAYLTVYGLFLFLMVGWLVWETRRWMAETPISALSRLRPYGELFMAALVMFLAAVGLAAALGYPVALISFPLALWAGVLFLRPGQSLEKRMVLALIASGAALTFVVEVVVLKGDIGRMNTVFKFYLQVWTLFSIASAAAFVWVLSDMGWWAAIWRNLWQLGLVFLVFGAALYPVTAAPAKISDRMANDAPHGLDGMAYMAYASRGELSTVFSTDEDYKAIRWMQANVDGSPVIVEANIPEYRWGTRYTIYTGLPGVVGWNWHQRQQRVITGSEQVTDRVMAVTDFYMTRSVDDAMAFLSQYNVKYIVWGQLEQIYYGDVQPCLGSGPDGSSVTCDLGGRALGMTQPDVAASECRVLDAQTLPATLDCPTHAADKFDTMVRLGDIKPVFQTGGTTIYEVVK